MTPASQPPAAHKVQPRHRDLLAVVYVRQSSPQQVTANRESADLQYQLRRRAADYGWAESRILVIDEDQGLSGQSIEGRLGFQRLLAEVTLGHVGIVFGREMSRLARSCKDWHHLLEVCSLFRVLLADADGVYDPNDPNDRMLLGLRGMMSEAELHLLRTRLLQGKRNKARRGEAFGFVPVGYVRTPDGGIGLDPDEQARAAVRLVFEKVAELGSARRAHAFLVAHDIRIGVRSYAGPDRGALTWRRPRLGLLHDMLRHPIYAGAYVYGRTILDPTRRAGGQPGRRTARPEEWVSLIRDKVPAYITWEQYEENRRRMAENDRGRTPSAGSGRTATLLNRLVQCGRCGRPMEATNRYGSGVPRYACDPAHKAVPGARCQSVAAPPIDRLIEALILGAVEPAALDLSLRAAEQAGRDRDRVHAAWRQKLERAAYEADRARRQYTAAEPEHRLVVRELERRWEDALAAARQVEEDYARFRADQPPELSAADRARIRSLATDLPGLWAAPTTGAADRREVVRLLLDAVEVSRQRGTEVIGVTVRWRGGAVSRHTVRQHLRGYADLGRRDELFARVRALAAAGETSHEIAEAVNAEGFVMPRGDGFTRDAIRRLIRVYRLGERSFGPSPGPDEWWLPDLCSALGVPRSVVYRWRRCGYVRTRQRGGSQTQWIIWADAPEVRRLRRLRAFEDAHRGQPPPVELTAPRSGPRGRGKRGGPSSGPTGGK